MTTIDDEDPAWSGTFDQLFHDHFVRVMRASYLVVLDRAEAEDIAQEAFARVLQRMHAGHHIDDTVAYLFTVAMNLARRRNRRVRRHELVSLSPRMSSMHDSIVMSLSKSTFTLATRTPSRTTIPQYRHTLELRPP